MQEKFIRRLTFNPGAHYNKLTWLEPVIQSWSVVNLKKCDLDEL